MPRPERYPRDFSETAHANPEVEAPSEPGKAEKLNFKVDLSWFAVHLSCDRWRLSP